MIVLTEPKNNIKLDSARQEEKEVLITPEKSMADSTKRIPTCTNTGLDIDSDSDSAKGIGTGPSPSTTLESIYDTTMSAAPDFPSSETTSDSGTPPPHISGNCNSQLTESCDPLASLSSLLSLSKKKRAPPVPKFTTNGAINPYNNVGFRDGSSCVSSTSSLNCDESTVGETPPSATQGYDVSATLASKQKRNGMNPPSAILNDAPSVISSLPDDAMAMDDSSAQTNNMGYALTNTTKTEPRVTLFDLDDDEAFIRTPIPKTLPNIHGDSIQPSNFLRGRRNTTTTSASSNSDPPSSGSSADFLRENQKEVEASRKAREQENVGRLVVKAKQQHSFAQAWFAEAETNALPVMMPRKKKGDRKKKLPSNVPPELMKLELKKFTIRVPKRMGPIDLDSGEAWDEGDGDADGKKSVATGVVTTHTMKTSKRGNFITFGVPEEEDLTQRKGLDRIVCTIGRKPCSLLVLFIILMGVVAVTGVSVVIGLKYGLKNESEIPLALASDHPSYLPTVVPTTTLSLMPSLRPTRKPSYSPSTTPSGRPSPSPSVTPTTMPSFQPSSQPSLSFAPTKVYNNTQFTQYGGDLSYNEKINDKFGSSVSLSADGQILAVGTPDFRALGSVTVYRMIKSGFGKEWKPLGQMIQGYVDDNQFGWSIKLSADGLTVAVGEPAYKQNTGRVQVFTYHESNDRWDQIGRNITGYADSDFGLTVCISGDGRRLAVGAPNHNLLNIGLVAVYIFDDDEQDWSDPHYLKGRNEFFDYIGHDVSLSGDGGTLAISTFGGNLKLGLVVTYKLKSDNITYGEGIQIQPLITFTEFGRAISLSYDGSRLAVGSPSYEQTGRVDVYQSAGSTWTPVGMPITGTPAIEGNLGYSVSMSSDGTRVAIGSKTSGEVLVNQLTNGDWGTGIVVQSKATMEGCGHDVDLASNGNYLAFGCPHDLYGKARVYQWEN